MNKIIGTALIKLADELDEKGLPEAEIIDEILKEEGPSVGLEQLIVELNKDLEFEYAAMIQYIQHAAMMQGAQFDSIRAEMLKHAEEEHGHAVEVSDKINYLGGVPSIDVEKIEISQVPEEMLMQDCIGEKLAIRRYKERIDQACEVGEYGLKDMLLRIIADEEGHLNDLTVSLGISRDDVEQK